MRVAGERAVTTIERTEALPVVVGNPVEAPERLISTTSVEGFRATRAKVRIEHGAATLDAAAMDALRLMEGELVRVRQ